MKKATVVCLASVVAVVLSGCASSRINRDPMRFDYSVIDKTPEQIRDAAVATAKDNGWTICAYGENFLRADYFYKGETISADIAYNNVGFAVSPNLPFTTLKNKKGKVHRTVNNLVKNFAGQIKKKVHHPLSSDNHEVRICRNAV